MSSASMPESESYAAAAAASSSESTAGFLGIFLAFACGSGYSRSLNSSRTRSLAWKIFARAFAISAVGRSFSRLRRWGRENASESGFGTRQRFSFGGGAEEKKGKPKASRCSRGDDRVCRDRRDTAHLAPFHPSMSYASIMESCWRIALI